MSKKPTSIAAGLLLALAIAALSGCGGEAESAPTKAAFIKQAEVICERADDKQLTAVEAAAKDKPLEELKRSEQVDLFIGAGMPPLEDEAKELGELTAPTGDESKVEAFVAAIEEAIEKAKANPQTMVSESSSPFNKADAQAKKYGLDECADSS